MFVIFKFRRSIVHNKTTREGRARSILIRLKKKHATRTPNATCHHPGASLPSNLNRRIKPNVKNGTQKWNENWAFHENVPWRFIFMLSSIFDLIFDSFSIENWNENWNENWPKILPVSIPNTADIAQNSHFKTIYSFFSIHHVPTTRFARGPNLANALE